MTALPDKKSEYWWRLISLVGSDLGNKCKSVDLILRELITLAQDRIKLVLFVSGPASWQIVNSVCRNKFGLANVADEGESHWGDVRKLHKRLGSPDHKIPLRCVIIKPSLVYFEAYEKSDAVLPVQRLFAILWPGCGDISILTVFSMVVVLLTLTFPIGAIRDAEFEHLDHCVGVKVPMFACTLRQEPQGVLFFVSPRRS